MSGVGDNHNSGHVELDPQHEELVVRWSNRMIRHGVRALSLLMLFIIMLAMIDAGLSVYQKLLEPPIHILGSGPIDFRLAA